MSFIHWLYLAIVIIVIGMMILKRGVVLITTLGTFLIGVVYKRGFIGGIQTVYRAFFSAGTDLFDIILIIALMIAMLKSMEKMGANYLMIAPACKFLKNPTIAFFSLGLIMYITALFFWPTPATALVGTILIPIAVKQGLTPIAAAMSVNILGHGMALSGDMILQGAARITSGAAGVEISEMIFFSTIFSLVSGVTAIFVAFLLMRKELVVSPNKVKLKQVDDEKEREFLPGARIIARAVPLVFLAVIVVMVGFKIKGEDSTALLGGIAIGFVIVNSFIQYGHRALEEMGEYLKQGFLFAIKIFSTVIPIAGFFFLGSPESAETILGEGAPGLLFDLGQVFSQHVPLSRVSVASGLLLVGAITGLDGSGFSSLPLIGALAKALGDSIGANTAALAAIGQMSSIWAGGGTLTAWAFGLVATAGIAGVSPMELARKNFIPVITGLIIATIIGVLIM